MLPLRLVRGSRPLVQLRRLLVAAACAGSGLLLLYVLADAQARPAGSFPRLLWALVPLAATVQFAVAVARTDPATRPREGLDAFGLGPVRLALAAAVSTAVACGLGSALALAAFLHLRGELAGLPFDGAGARLLHAGRPLPVAAALTLLALLPLTASAATALALRPRPPHSGPAPQTGVPWGVALTACGLGLLAYARPDGPAVPAAGALIAVGLALAGPGLAYACGTWCRPSAREHCGCWPGGPCRRRPPGWAGPSGCCAPSGRPPSRSPWPPPAPPGRRRPRWDR